jgi:hypothetical protein
LPPESLNAFEELEDEGDGALNLPEIVRMN